MEKKCLRGKGISLKQRMRTFALLFMLLQICFLSNVFAQTISVNGVVKDGKGSPVSGVTVNVKGTAINSITDIDGKYNVKVPTASSVLVFTFVGFTTKEETVDSRKTINVTMSESSSDLDEVIIVGYGASTKKKDLTGAIGTVSSKQINERQPVTLFDALQGQVSGVMVMNDNGDPAGQGSIQIRGASTINSGNGPLYVIDGIMSDNANYINPNDIESIEVFKDASSAAIYGARGANGVILITTKKGKDGRPLINATYTHTIGQLAHKLRTTSADELRLYRKMRGDGNAGANVDSLNPYLNQDNDFQDLMFRTAHKQVFTVSASGGQKGLTFYTGATYTDDRSIVINSWIKRIQARANIEYQASKKLKIVNNLSVSYQTGNDIPVATALKVVFDRNPWTAITRPDGSYTGYVESKRNPVAQALFSKSEKNLFTAQYNTRLEYLIYKDLRFTTSFNISWNNNRSIDFVPSSLTSTGTGDATGANGFTQSAYWEYQAFFNYNKTIKGKHNFTGLLGFSADKKRTDNFNISMNNFLDESVFTSNAAQTINLTKTGTDASSATDASVFGRLGYNYSGKYILEGSFRTDGSSKFGANNKFGTFYAGSAAWRFSQETFMTWASPYITDGKLRLSVGQTGNDRIDDNASRTLINYGGEYYNGSSVAAPNSRLGNPNIKWETTTQKDLGLDLTFNKGKITFTADYYMKTTSNLLYNQKLAGESGVTDVYVNIGTLQTNGLELNLTATPVTTKNFQWQVTGNVTFQSSKIKELANHQSFISGDKWLIQEGGRLGDFYVFQNLGVYQWNESNAYDPASGRKLGVVLGADGKPNGSYTLDGKPFAGTPQAKYTNGLKLLGGDTEWLDLNNDGVIDDKDRVIAGNAVPKQFFGFINTFRYKNFTLNFMFNGNLGYQIYNGVKNAQNANSSTYSPPSWDAILGSWQKQGDIATYPYFPAKDTRYGIRNGINSLYVEDGSFIRLTSAKLTYTFSGKFIQQVKMKSLGVYIFGNNLGTWTKYSWYDPEFSSSGLNIGADNGKYPKRREIGLGINANF
ncbi:MAG: TonB-dependent receptor [Filimonas sp.]|nr:TonB-dependent receptor [Filimonas sp.]